MKISRRSLMGWMGMTGGTVIGSRWFKPSATFAASPLTDLLSGAVEAPAAAAGPTRWQTSAQKKRDIAADITWLTHEPMEFLFRRGGDHFDDEPDHYARMVSDDNIKRMSDAGVRWGRIFFYKGFGLQYERPHIDIAKTVARNMHAQGMKVSLYMAGTMFPETLYRELPDAKSWEQRDQSDQPVTYGTQVFRRYACPNEPAYREYLKQILQIGVNELYADEIAFDNIMLQPEPKSCRCPRCLKAFAEFLRNKYTTRDAMMRRFGLPDADWIMVNQWESFNQPDSITTVDDPVLQEWVRFRCESLANHSKALYDAVKTLNPDVCVLFNIKGIFSFNRYWTNAVYHPLYANHIDLMAFDTGGYDEHIDPETGALISQIRTYKIARKLGCGCEDTFSVDLRAAVHMAFGTQTAVKGAAPPPFGPGAHNVFTPLVEFFREFNDRYYTETQNVADVAVLRNWPSMAFSINAAYTPAALMEQVLIQYKVPFDILFEEQLDHLDKYAAVILAGQECVSDAQAQTLLQYVKAGGTLVVAGNTGQFNDWREKRRSNPLLPARNEGKGKIIVINDITPATHHGSSDSNADPFALTGRAAPKITPKDWVLPTNHKEIYQAVTAAIPNGLSLTSEAPLTTVAEILSRSKTNETIVHFVNFDHQKPTDAFNCSVRKQFQGAIQSVSCFTPDANDPISVTFQESNGMATFTVPATRLYSMIVIAQQG